MNVERNIVEMVQSHVNLMPVSNQLIHNALKRVSNTKSIALRISSELTHTVSALGNDLYSKRFTTYIILFFINYLNMNKLFIVLLIIYVNADAYEDCLKANCPTLYN